MVVARAVEPRFLALAGDVDDERVAVPASTGPSHPRIGRRFLLPVHADDARGARKLVRDLHGTGESSGTIWKGNGI